MYSEVFGHEMDTVEFENMLSKIGCQKAIAILSVEDYEVVCNLIENCPDELPTILTSWYKDQRVDKRSAVVLVNYLSSYGKQYVCSQYISHLFARSLSEISLRTFGKDITSNLNIQ